MNKDFNVGVGTPLKVIDGVGKDTEIITNREGGKQSKTPASLHLIDPAFLRSIICETPIADFIVKAIFLISIYMELGDTCDLYRAVKKLEPSETRALITIGGVLQYGADRYETNNWRLIPRESHLNHALIHLVAALAGDTQDDHIDHALCRLMMAIATKESEGFSYTEYIPKEETD